MTIDVVRLTRWYVWLLGVGLLLDGGGLLIVNALGVQNLPINVSDVRHNLLHVVWGLALVVVGVISREGHDERVAWAAVIFGAFYVALGVVGLTIDQPFGLQLGPGENAFHFIVGPIALILGGWSLKTLSSAPVPLHTAAQQAAARNGRVARRRPRHRPGNARARSRRR